MKFRGSKLDRMKARIADLKRELKTATDDAADLKAKLSDTHARAAAAYHLVELAEAHAMRRRAWAVAWKRLAKEWYSPR